MKSKILEPGVASGQVSLSQTVWWSAAIFLLIGSIYISGVKPIGISADLLNYELLYNGSAISDWATVLGGSDAGYFTFAKLAATGGLSFDAFALFLAAGTCTLLYFVAKEIDTNRTILIIIYFSYLFWLHEYTQIRIAASIAIGLYAIYVARPTVRLPLFFAAVLFHNSFVAVVGVYALMKARRIDVLALFGLAGGAIYLSPFSDGLAQRIVNYQDLASATGQFSDINLLSLMPLVQLMGIGLAIIHFKKLGNPAREELILSAVGLASFYILSSLPVLAFRTYELFMPFFVILLSRLWRDSIMIKGVVLAWILLGLRSAFLAADSVVIL